VSRHVADLQRGLQGGDAEGHEGVADFYKTADPDTATELLRDIIDHASKRSAPYEVRPLATTLRNWFEQIVAWHEAKVDGPTEGINNLLKRVKRVAFGLNNFQNFRVLALLCAGNPSFRVLDSIVVR
jgi:transposase